MSAEKRKKPTVATSGQKVPNATTYLFMYHHHQLGAPCGDHSWSLRRHEIIKLPLTFPYVHDLASFRICRRSGSAHDLILSIKVLQSAGCQRESKTIQATQFLYTIQPSTQFPTAQLNQLHSDVFVGLRMIEKIGTAWLCYVPYCTWNCTCFMTEMCLW